MTASSARARVKAVLKQTPLRTVAWWCRYWTRILIDPTFRGREIAAEREYRLWRREHGAVLGSSLRDRRSAVGTALIIGKGTVNGAKIESGLVKGLELAGFVPVVLTDRRFAKFYRLAGVSAFLYWEDFADQGDGVGAEETVGHFQSVGAALAFHHAGARVGRFAVSTALRFLRVGHLDLGEPRTRRVLAEHVADGMVRASAARRILRRARPSLAVFLGNRYTGQGELMDACLAEGVSVITWFEAHRSNTLMLKRYGPANRDQHHASLSEESWQLVRRMELTADHRRELTREIDHNYATGDWYCRGGTQFDRAILDSAQIRERLGLDPRKKTAVIFPHIVWDATLFWGQDLFDNYEEWLIETVRAACANTHVNWVIKIHPANVVKSAWEGYAGEPAEVTAIGEHIGPLPPHVFVIPAASDVNTFSLFAVMDYCVTVRGTIGIEAANCGVTVLTAGSGRYDGKGFTIDSESREEYLDRLASIQDIPRPTPAQRDLAQRFAYAVFILRPLSLQTISIEYERDREASMKVGLNARSAEELRTAPDLQAFAHWVAHSTSEDFLALPSRMGRAWPRSA